MRPNRSPSRTSTYSGALAESPKVVAIGEIGLDFYRNLSPPDAQRRAFQQQLKLARDLNLPVVIHAREADEETFDILGAYADDRRNEWPADRPIGVMHCFAGDLALALRYIDLGFVISIPGTVTYPNAKRLQAVCRGLPLRSMVIETDAPYLHRCRTAAVATSLLISPRQPDSSQGSGASHSLT